MAQADYYLKIEGVEGESAAKGHEKEIELESFSFGVANMAAGSHGGGGGAGKASFQDLHCHTKVNKASPKLFLGCATGEHFKKAVLTCRKAGKDQQEYLKVTMSDIFVSSYQDGGSSGGGVIPTDQFSLNFSKIEFEYKEQKADGTLGASVKTGFDVKAGVKV